MQHSEQAFPPDRLVSNVEGLCQFSLRSKINPTRSHPCWRGRSDRSSEKPSTKVSHMQFCMWGTKKHGKRVGKQRPKGNNQTSSQLAGVLLWLVPDREPNRGPMFCQPGSVAHFSINQSDGVVIFKRFSSFSKITDRSWTPEFGSFVRFGCGCTVAGRGANRCECVTRQPHGCSRWKIGLH